MDISRKYSTLSQVWKSFWVSELNVFAVYWVPGAPWRLKIPVSDLQNLLYFFLSPTNSVSVRLTLHNSLSCTMWYFTLSLPSISIAISKTQVTSKKEIDLKGWIRKNITTETSSFFHGSTLLLSVFFGHVDVSCASGSWLGFVNGTCLWKVLLAHYRVLQFSFLFSKLMQTELISRGGKDLWFVTIKDGEGLIDLIYSIL